MRYRKIDPRIWNDAKFRKLSDHGKLAFLFILTHPHMTSIGAMRGTIHGLAAEMGWEFDAMSDAIADGSKMGLVEVDGMASCIGVPNFLKYNEPEGPNSVRRAWVEALDLIPECAYKKMLISRIYKYLSGKSEEFKKAIGDAIWDAMSEPSAIQEQEQEQEQEQDIGLGKTAATKVEIVSKIRDRMERVGKKKSGGAGKGKTPLPPVFEVTPEMREWAAGKGVASVDHETEKFMNHWQSNGEMKVDWNATWRNWMLNSLDFNRSRGRKGQDPADPYHNPKLERMMSESGT